MSVAHRFEIPIVYNDEHLCIIDKPADLFVHSHPLAPSAPNCVSILSKKLDSRVYNVHRIDRPTSGLVVFALSQPSAAELSRQIREGSITKRYVALVRGHLKTPVEIDHPVPKSKHGEKVDARSTVRPVSTVVVDRPVGKYDEGWFSLVEITIETGRFHQARRHLRSIGHHVIGDSSHGDPAQNKFFRDIYGVSLMFLRAYFLDFSHPVNGETMSVTAGLPSEWRGTLRSIGLVLPSDLSTEPLVSFETGALR